MMKLKALRIFALLALILSLLTLQVSAEVDTTLQNKCAATLVRLQLLRGDQNGNLKLQDKVRRCEFITLVIRMLGYENDKDTSGVDFKFTDISSKHWAYNNMKIALKYKLITGYNDNTLKPDNYVTFTEARAVLVRALGYESTMTGKWPDNVINKASDLGLNKDIDLPKDKEITRGETSVLIYNSLTVKFNR